MTLPRKNYQAMKTSKVIIVMPAYNAAKTLKKTYNDVPEVLKKNIILVDDGSHDKTVKIAKSLGIETFVHPQNRGYGGNQKTCYSLALDKGADVIIMIHPDYQYDSSLSIEMIRPIKDGRFDIMLGSRIRSRKEALTGGMPLYKYISNRFLTITENIILDQNLSEYHTGYRAFNRKVLQKLPFHKFSDDFVFDQEILISAVYSGFKIGEIPVPVRYSSDASSINFQRSLKYGIETLLSLLKFQFAYLKVYKPALFA